MILRHPGSVSIGGSGCVGVRDLDASKASLGLTIVRMYPPPSRLWACRV